MTHDTSEQNVDQITLADKELVLVGTAHVSQASVDLVKDVIAREQPDSVAVELCQPRYESLRDPNRWRDTDIVEVIRKGKMYLLLGQLLIASFQRRIGKDLDVKPGAEMLQAIESAEQHGAEIALADREISTTLRRTWNSLGFFSVLKLLASMLFGAFSDEKVDQAEIERLKSADALEEVMAEFADSFPDVKTALIDERDQYLAAKIAAAPGKKIVAVVGAGHVPGIKRWLGKEIDLEQLRIVPPMRKVTKVISWGIPLLIFAMVAYGFFQYGAETSVEMVKVWVLVNAIATGIGAACAFAHPATIAAAMIASPFTSVNPLVAAGWVAGLVEATIRKPRVADLENLGDDIAKLSGFWHNRVTRILLIVALSNLGSSIGTFVGVPWLAALLRNG